MYPPSPKSNTSSTDNLSQQDIAQHIKKEVRRRSPHTSLIHSTDNPSSSIRERALPGIALLAGTLEALSLMVSVDWLLSHAQGHKANTPAETKHFIYFYLGHCAILLFKTQ